jgi:predicted metalloprotease
VRLDDVEGSSGIEDRRGRGGSGGLGGGLGGLPIGKGGGIAGIVIALVIAFLSRGALSGGGGDGGTGIDMGDILGQMGGGQANVASAPTESGGGAKDAQYEFVNDLGVVLEDFWSEQFKTSNQQFAKPGIVLFDAPTSTGGCGVGQPEFGPFYCPGDSKIYIDLTFYEKLEQQLGFSGDFALAYVMAHEYGHHIQNVLGINDEVTQAGRGASQDEVNELSVRTELQADCFAGAWAKSAYEDERLEAGDFDEAITAAKAVGDDAIQQRTTGQVNPEGWTHGSSADRQKWFRTGYDSGDPSSCDTF